MSDELKPEIEGSAAPVQEPPKPEVPEQKSEPTPLDPRYVELVEKAEQRLSGKFGQILDAKTRPIKDETAAISQELNKIKALRFKDLNAAVDAGLDPVVAATRQRQIEIETWEQQQTLQQAQRPTTEDPYAAQARAARAWRETQQDMLDAADLTGEEPEFRELIAKANYDGVPWEEAKADFKRKVKQARKAVDARVHPKAEEKPKMTPPLMDAGAGSGTSPSSETPQEELERLNRQGPPDDPKQAKQHWKRVTELGG